MESLRFDKMQSYDKISFMYSPILLKIDYYMYASSEFMSAFSSKRVKVRSFCDGD